MENEKIKEAIDYLGAFMLGECKSDATRHVRTLVCLAEDVVALDGMVKKDLNNFNCEEIGGKEWISQQGFNEGREQTIKALAGRMQGLRKVIADFMEFDPAEEAWYMYNDGAVKDLAQALRNHLLKEE